MAEQKPSIGRIVRYCLTEEQAEQVNRRRTTGMAIAIRIEEQKWPTGAQAHIGNAAHVGDVFPMIIVRLWPDEYGPGRMGINGQVMLDGNDVLWVTSVKEQTEWSEPNPVPGTWHWPPRT